VCILYITMDSRLIGPVCLYSPNHMGERISSSCVATQRHVLDRLRGRVLGATQARRYLYVSAQPSHPEL
jgi:hypothetical protein